MPLIPNSLLRSFRGLRATCGVLVALAVVAPLKLYAIQTAKSPSRATARQQSSTSKKKRPTTKPQGAVRAKKPARPTGALGPASSEKHLAYKGMGSDLDSLWPPKMPTSLPGSILPTKRIIAFYGNPLSKRMGILGEFETDDMLQRLDREVAEWNRLDPSHPVQPALHLIAVVAQGDAGTDGKYRARMDSALIEKRLHERLTLTNFSEHDAEVPLKLRFAADFADIFEVQGHVRKFDLLYFASNCKEIP